MGQIKMNMPDDLFISDQPKCDFFKANKPLVDFLLSRNTGNRTLRPRYVDYFVREIESGGYCLTNNGVGIDVDGVVFDHQHRLQAIKKAGYKPVTLLIVWGLPKESITAIDCGLKRTVTDFFHYAMEHPDITAKMAAVIRTYGLMNYHYRKSYKPSNREVFEWYEEIHEALKIVFNIKGVSSLPAPVLAAVCTRLKDNIEDQSMLVFLDKLITGEGLEKDSPILRLRNWLILKQSSGGGFGMMIERFDRTATALIAYIENRQITKLFSRRDALKKMMKATKYRLEIDLDTNGKVQRVASEKP